MTLTCHVAGITFQNPLLLASGTAAYGREIAGTVALSRLGGIVTKAVSLEPRNGNPPPRVAEFPGGMLNSIGLANPGWKAIRERELSWLASHRGAMQVLVNVVGFTVGEYAEVISKLDDLQDHSSYEINLSCPNTAAGGIEFGADAGSVASVVSRCRAQTGRPLFAKLSPALPDIVAIAKAAIDAGATGLTLVNTLPGVAYPEYGARLGAGPGGVSGPALYPLGVAAVQRVTASLPGVPVIGAGGVRSANDVRAYLRAGASLVAIGTAALADPHLPVRIVTDLEHGDG